MCDGVAARLVDPEFHAIVTNLSGPSLFNHSISLARNWGSTSLAATPGQFYIATLDELQNCIKKIRGILVEKQKRQPSGYQQMFFK